MKTTKISVSIKMGSLEVKTSTDISVCESKPRRRAAVARLVAGSIFHLRAARH